MKNPKNSFGLGTWNVYSDQYKQTKKLQGLEVTERQQQQQQQQQN